MKMVKTKKHVSVSRLGLHVISASFIFSSNKRLSMSPLLLSYHHVRRTAHCACAAVLPFRWPSLSLVPLGAISFGVLFSVHICANYDSNSSALLDAYALPLSVWPSLLTLSYLFYLLRVLAAAGMIRPLQPATRRPHSPHPYASSMVRLLNLSCPVILVPNHFHSHLIFDSSVVVNAALSAATPAGYYL